VDDEQDIREIFAAWFRNVGCHVTEVTDGIAALETLSAAKFDAIVTDVRMPRLDGIHFVERLRQSGTYIPTVIFVSGFVDLPVADAFDLGVEAMLSKPCERKLLLSTVQRSLMRRDLVFLPPDSLQPPPLGSYVRQDSYLPSADPQIALGRGGMSLDVPQEILGDECIGFSLEMQEGPLTRLEGWGVSRWCDSADGSHRVGIEFLHLEESSRAQFSRWLEQQAPISFIPKQTRAYSARSA
jgi:CheY-like chemotaxis protein